MTSPFLPLDPANPPDERVLLTALFPGTQVWECIRECKYINGSWANWLGPYPPTHYMPRPEMPEHE